MVALVLQIAALTLGMVASGLAPAEIYKCTDTRGSISYGEAPCAPSEKQSVELKGKPFGAMSVRNDGDSTSKGSRSDAVPADPTPTGPDEMSAESAAKTLQRAQLQAEAARQRIAEERSPGKLINCNEAGCWGAKNGVRYLFGADGKLAGTNGSTCIRVSPNQFICD